MDRRGVPVRAAVRQVQPRRVRRGAVGRAARPDCRVRSRAGHTRVVLHSSRSHAPDGKAEAAHVPQSVPAGVAASARGHPLKDKSRALPARCAAQRRPAERRRARVSSGEHDRAELGQRLHTPGAPHRRAPQDSAVPARRESCLSRAKDPSFVVPCQVRPASARV
eukprot:Amastigsp_a1422_94.p2 type:complete len:165 gc:universal Amastigsp_a1422_94:804-1298(+)